MTGAHEQSHRRDECGPCAWCGAPVPPRAFRDLTSAKEHHILGICQRCQDALYLAEPQHRPGPPLPLHDGVVVATATAGGALAELAVLPFVFVEAEARIAWEPRALLHAGPRREARLDRYEELTPMRGPWAEHQMRVTELDAVDHPRVRETLAGAALIVGLDRTALDAVRAACRVPPEIALAPLADTVPWRALYRHPLLPFERFVDHLRLDPEGTPGARPSVVRLAALIAAALELPGPAGPPPRRIPFLRLLGAVRTRLGDGR